MKFGEQLKAYRIRKGITLRECCSELGIDPSNWSKMERGINPAPKDIDLVCFWGEFFRLNEEEIASFKDSAALSRKEIPEDIASDEEIMSKLPAFFRVARGNELNEEKVKSFIEDIRKLHTRDKNV